MIALPALLAAVALALPGGAAAAHASSNPATRVPGGFVGMNADGPLFSSHVDLAAQFKKMAASGIKNIRVEFDWALAQPYAECSQAPGGCTGQPFVAGPGGVPTDFTRTDQVVAAAARRHLGLLPVVTFSPSWDRSSTGTGIQPAHDKPYGWYLTSLVKRYGPDGSFWSTHTSLPQDPITRWQIWNEPDLSYYWGTQPFAHSYMSLVKVARRSIKQVDPKATVVLGALTNYGWRDLESIYKVHGSRGLFDEVAADVYTGRPSGVITILGYYRRVMSKQGDGAKPLLATEVGWPSDQKVAQANTPFATTEKGQATKLSRLLPLLAKNRTQLRLAGFFYYTWMSTDRGSPRTWYFYSGLLKYDRSTKKISPKPAYWAFRRTVRQLEG